MAKRRKICRCLKIISILIFAIQYCLSDDLASQRSCRDHYLNGQFENAILPLALRGKDQTYRVECEFPEYSSQPHLSVTTVIHSGLEQWITLNDSEKRTVIYQIANWKFLQTIVEESNSCSQSLFIDWGTDNGDKNNDFAVETLDGVQQSFQRNVSDAYADSTNLEVIHLEGHDKVPIVHLIPGRLTSRIRASPLRCLRPAISHNECLFDLLRGSAYLLIDLRATTERSLKTLSFSFRTDRTDTPFLSIDTEEAVIQVDLVDGYLIDVNHIIHPVGHLADGNWHRATIDFDIMTLVIDSSPTAISLRKHNLIDGSSVSAGPIRKIHILLEKAQVTAIRTDDVDGNENWSCDRKFVIIVRNPAALLDVNAAGRQFGFGRQVCSRGETTQSYCNCRAPGTALRIFEAPQPATCAISNGEHALYLSRVPHRFAFVYVPNLPADPTLSMVFKSELDNGLLLFGVSSHMESEFSDEEYHINIRLQIHFAGKNIVAMKCIRTTTDSVERCYSCSIHRPSGFITQDWLRVSTFSHLPYHFMALNEQICQLSPNSVASDSSEIYKISSTANNVLFVGGMYYAKHFQVNRRINDTLRHQFQDNTREKPLSFQGCIAELRINGNIQDLSQFVEKQKMTFAKTAEDASSIFAISRSGTCALNCPRDCNGAPCKTSEKSSYGYESYSNIVESAARPEADIHCDCPAIYRRRTSPQACQSSESEFFTNSENDRNRKKEGNSLSEDIVEESSRWKLPISNLIPQSDQSILLSSDSSTTLSVTWNSDNFNPNSAIGAIRNRILSKIWLLLRFPTIVEDQHTLLEIGAIEIVVANYGRKVIVNIEEYEIQEVFHVEAKADDRLHLLAIELNSAPGDGANSRRSIGVRLDADIRTFEGFESIPFFPTSDSVTLTPVLRSVSDEEERHPPQAPIVDVLGCIAEFVVNFKSNDEETWTVSTKNSGENLEENYLDRIVQAANKLTSTANLADSDANRVQPLTVPRCGIRDPTLWLHNSSAWGLVGEYNPSGISYNSSGRAMSLISTVLTMTLVLFIILLILCYCYTRFRKEKERMPCGYRYKANIASNGYNLSDDKRPLKSDSFFLDSPQNSSSSPQSPTRDNYDANDFNDRMEIYDPPMRLVTAVPSSNYVIVREDKRPSYNDEFVIDQYSSSPKLADRRHRSKAAILLRRPPDPPQQPLRLTPPQSESQWAGAGGSPSTNSHRSMTLPPAAVLAAARTTATPSPLSQHNKSSYASTAGLAAPIASQEDEIE